MTTVETFDILKLTDEARNVVLDALSAEGDSDNMGLYVEAVSYTHLTLPTILRV